MRVPELCPQQFPPSNACQTSGTTLLLLGGKTPTFRASFPPFFTISGALCLSAPLRLAELLFFPSLINASPHFPADFKHKAHTARPWLNSLGWRILILDPKVGKTPHLEAFNHPKIKDEGLLGSYHPTPHLPWPRVAPGWPWTLPGMGRPRPLWEFHHHQNSSKQPKIPPQYSTHIPLFQFEAVPPSPGTPAPWELPPSIFSRRSPQALNSVTPKLLLTSHNSGKTQIHGFPNPEGALETQGGITPDFTGI